MLQRELDLQNRSLLLPPVFKWYPMSIQYHFDSKPFTLKQLRLQLGKSKSRIYNTVRELKNRKMYIFPY